MCNYSECKKNLYIANQSSEMNYNMMSMIYMLIRYSESIAINQENFVIDSGKFAICESYPNAGLS